MKMTELSAQDLQKKAAGEYAASLVENKMVVGLGTGSTVKFFVDELGRRVNEEGLDIIGVTTSNRTTKQAEGLGIVVKKVDEVDSIDLTVDGADIVDAKLNGIKGGGAALLFEKVVAQASKKNIWIVDESKVHEKLGHFPLPVEVTIYGHQQLLNRFAAKGLNPKLRLTEDGQPLVTDGGHYIIDLDLDIIENPEELDLYLKAQAGVVEDGLFLNIAKEVIVGGEEIKTIVRDK